LILLRFLITVGYGYRCSSFEYKAACGEMESTMRVVCAALAINSSGPSPSSRGTLALHSTVSYKMEEASKQVAILSFESNKNKSNRSCQSVCCWCCVSVCLVSYRIASHRIVSYRISAIDNWQSLDSSLRAPNRIPNPDASLISPMPEAKDPSALVLGHSTLLLTLLLMTTSTSTWT